MVNVGATRIKDAQVNTATRLTSLWRLLQGLALATAVAALAISTKLLWPNPLINPIVIAVVLGMVIAAIFNIPATAKSGLTFASKVLLRISIVLLGFQLTLSELVRIGPMAVLVCALVLSTSFFFTKWLGRLLKIESGLAELLASGTAVCGASAIIATNTVTRASDSDVAYALGSITIFGTLSIVIYPFVMTAIGLPPELYALWAGASIHEVAQVVAAGSQAGPEAVVSATVVKLARVLMLAPLILLLSLYRRAPLLVSGPRAPIVPWFIAGFILLIAVGSAFEIPLHAKQTVGTITSFLFTVALAALGLSTHFRSVIACGWRPILVGAGAWLFIALFALLAILIFVNVGSTQFWVSTLSSG